MDLEVSGGEDDCTPLHWAVVNGHPAVVLYLCEQGADKEARNRDSNTPLHLVARWGRLHVVQYFEGLK